MNAGVDRHGVPRPGTMLAGKYVIEEILGAGGMGVVVSARHVDLGQKVAIKFLNSQLATKPDFVSRFLREARAAAAIQSEHVTRVFDVARGEDGAPFMVMEHLSGQNLDQLLRIRGPLPVEEAVEYLLQAGEAIAEAHAAGIVHRDLKPANLFLTRRADGTAFVKVLDFGMSKIMADAAGDVPEGSLTAASDVLGSPWYMSPEQVRSTKNVDHRTDIWSLGVILHKLLTATQAFEASSLSACLVSVATEPPIALRSRRPSAPEGLEAVILRCLQKSPGQRYQNVSQLATALLPFAPPASKLSVDRIARIIGADDAVTEETIRRPAPLIPAPTPSQQSLPLAPAPMVAAPAVEPGSLSSMSSPQSVPAVAPSRRGLFAVGGVVLGVALGVAGWLAFSSPAGTDARASASGSSLAAASAAPEQRASAPVVSSVAPPPTVSPVFSASPAAPTVSVAASAAPPSNASPLARPKGQAAGPAPKAPAKSGGRKSIGPVENTL